MAGSPCAGLFLPLRSLYPIFDQVSGSFLEKDIPDQEFPRGNRPDQMISSIGNLYMEEMYQAAIFNMCCIVTGCLAALAALVAWNGIWEWSHILMILDYQLLF